MQGLERGRIAGAGAAHPGARGEGFLRRRAGGGRGFQRGAQGGGVGTFQREALAHGADGGPQRARLVGAEQQHEPVFGGQLQRSFGRPHRLLTLVQARSRQPPAAGQARDFLAAVVLRHLGVRVREEHRHLLLLAVGVLHQQRELEGRSAGLAAHDAPAVRLVRQGFQAHRGDPARAGREFDPQILLVVPVGDAHRPVGRGNDVGHRPGDRVCNRGGRGEPAVGVRLEETERPGLPAGQGLGGCGCGGLQGQGVDVAVDPRHALAQVGAFHDEFGWKGRLVVVAAQIGVRRVAVVGVDAPLLHVCEEGGERVEVAQGEGVVLVVVALRAAHGAAEEGRADGAHAVGGVFGQVFARLRAALAGHHVEPVEPGGDALFVGGVGQEVAGELFDGEAVEALVGVEGVDDVVAIGEDALVLVAVVADGVGEARDIEPPHGHAFAEMRGGEQAFDLFGVGVGRGVRDEGGDFGGGGRQAGEVERQPA